jgi:hypothetical protein
MSRNPRVCPPFPYTVIGWSMAASTQKRFSAVPPMQGCLVSVHAVDHPLVEVGGPKAPGPAHELDIVRVVHLGEVVEARCFLRERHEIRAPVVVDLDVPLFDIDVGGPVLAHRPQLHQMGLWGEVLHGEQDVQRADNVVHLRDDGMTSRQHGERSGSMFRVVHDRLGVEFLPHVFDEVPVGDVADVRLDGLLLQACPQIHPVLKREDRDQGIGPDLMIEQSPVEAIHNGDVVSPLGQVHGGRPPQVAVATQDENLHVSVTPSA